jgi:GT2 family glycosyltransferase
LRGPKPLLIVPTYMSEDFHLKLATNLVTSISATAKNDVEIFVVDDGSPRQDLVDSLDKFIDDGIFSQQNLVPPRPIFRQENSGFSAAVNVGLKRALDEGRDAILCNADIEFLDKGWVGRFQETKADVVGAMLLFPNGLIQHAGVYYSLIFRQFDHRFHFCPADLAEALVPCRCPVTAALQYIHVEAIDKFGLYDEDFRMGYEDVDYCHRVFMQGGECIYNPLVRAIHYEGAFRRTRKLPEHIRKWQQESQAYLAKKYEGFSFADFVPTMILDHDEFQ